MTDLTLFDKAIVQSEQARVAAFVAAIGELHISSDEEAEDAANTGRRVKAMAKALEETRFSYTRPLLAEKAKWDEAFKPVEALLKDAETYLKGELDMYRVTVLEAQERERAALEAASIRAAEEGRQDDAEQALVEADAVPVKFRAPAGTSVQSRWHAEVTDLQALVLAVATGEAPLNLIRVNEQALLKIAQATHAPSTIPGTRFWKTETTAMSAR